MAASRSPTAFETAGWVTRKRVPAWALLAASFVLGVLR